MKRLVVVMCVLLLSLSLFSCSGSSVAEEDFGKSKLFSEEERKAAAEVVKEKFSEAFKECEMTKLRYGGDQVSQEKAVGVAVAKKIDEKKMAKNAIVFYCDFSVGEKSTKKGFQAGATYNSWEWVLYRDGKNGEWKFYEDGYGTVDRKIIVGKASATVL